MAQYFTDFSKKGVGGVPAGWTARWATGSSTWSIIQSGLERILRHNQTVSDERILEWDLIPNAANIEIYVKCRTSSNSGYQNTLFVRANTNAASKNAYYLTMNETAGQKRLMLEQWNNGSYLYWYHVDYNWVANTIYKIRYRVQGNWHYAKIWPASSPEPSGWTLSRQDTSGTQWNGSGLFALGGYTNSGNRDWFEVGVGTGGDTAPTSAFVNARGASSFARRVAKVWNGSSWVPRSMKAWSGSQWVAGD